MALYFISLPKKTPLISSLVKLFQIINFEKLKTYWSQNLGFGSMLEQPPYFFKSKMSFIHIRCKTHPDSRDVKMWGEKCLQLAVIQRRVFLFNSKSTKSRALSYLLLKGCCWIYIFFSNERKFFF